MTKKNRKECDLSEGQKEILLTMKELGAVSEDTCVSYAEIALRLAERLIREMRLKKEFDIKHFDAGIAMAAFDRSLVILGGLP